jgi:hypothetical protein
VSPDGGQTDGIASLNTLGTIAWHRGDSGQAAGCPEESVSAFRELGDRARLAAVLTNLGALAHEPGDLTRATTLCEGSAATSRDLGDQSRIAMAADEAEAYAPEEGDPLCDEGLAKRVACSLG